jgi:hypothetical protein
MIRLTDLSGKGSFTMGGKKFEYGKVYSNPYATVFKPVNEGEESEDHEVSMAQNQLDSIIKHATELKQKMGEDEKQIPAWIQDHITNSENYISQAASNYHEYGDSNEVNEDIKFRDGKYEFLSKSGVATLKYNGKELSNGDFDRGADGYFMSHSSYKGQKFFNDGKAVISYFKKNRIVNEAGPCWKNFKQVGMKKGKDGKPVPNCVPESVMNEASVAKLHKDLAKVVEAIEAELKKYKSNKGTPKAKQNVENLKKLNITKKKIEADMDKTISGLYKDAELEEGCGCK